MFVSYFVVFDANMAFNVFHCEHMPVGFTEVKVDQSSRTWQLDDLPDHYLFALITCCELPKPELLTRNTALVTLRHTPDGRARIQLCKYKASLPNFVELVRDEKLRYYTNMQVEGVNRPDRYKPRAQIRKETDERWARMQRQAEIRKKAREEAPARLAAKLEEDKRKHAAKLAAREESKKRKAAERKSLSEEAKRQKFAEERAEWKHQQKLYHDQLMVQAWRMLRYQGLRKRGASLRQCKWRRKQVMRR